MNEDTSQKICDNCNIGQLQEIQGKGFVLVTCKMCESSYRLSNGLLSVVKIGLPIGHRQKNVKVIGA